MRINVPNVLTTSRLLLAPFVYYAGFMRDRELFLVLFALGGITDALDGFFARHLNVKSDWGSFFDMIADIAFYPSALMVYFFVPEVFLNNTLIVLGVVGAFVVAVGSVWLKGKWILPHLLSAKIWAVFLYLFVLYTVMFEYSPPFFYVVAAVGVWAALEQFIAGWRKK